MDIKSAGERRRLIFRFSLLAGLGWMLFQVCVEILLGPHISLPRTVTIGSGVGALVGLLTSSLQWLVLRRYRSDAGWWIPATTIGCTAGGIIGAFVYSMAVRHVGPFDITLPSSGIIESLVVGSIMATCQWLVLRNWVSRAGLWIPTITLGIGLAVPVGWLAGAGILALFNLVLGFGVWPVILVIAYLAGGLAGGGAFALFSALALHRVLPRPGEVTDSLATVQSGLKATTP